MLRFDPFSELDAMTRALFTTTGSDRSPRFMPMDLYKIDDHYVLNADLPGVDPGSVDVSVDHGMLTITAKRSAQPEGNSVQWMANERFFGTYRRQLSLGEGVDADKISATYENGVLSVTIPLAERAKPRRIEVTSAGSRQSIEPATVDSA